MPEVVILFKKAFFQSIQLSWADKSILTFPLQCLSSFFTELRKCMFVQLFLPLLQVTFQANPESNSSSLPSVNQKVQPNFLSLTCLAKKCFILFIYSFLSTTDHKCWSLQWRYYLLDIAYIAHCSQIIN